MQLLFPLLPSLYLLAVQNRHFSNSLVNCVEWWSLIKEKNMSQKLLGPKRYCFCLVNLIGKNQATNHKPNRRNPSCTTTSEHNQSYPNEFHFIYLEHYIRVHRAVTRTSMFCIRYLRKISNICNQH